MASFERATRWMTGRGVESPRIRWSAGYLVAAAAVLVLALGLSPVVKLELVVNGLFLGSIIALGAMGLTLVYGILKFAHIAHGDFMTMGGYISFLFLGTIFPHLGLGAVGWGPFTFGYPLLIAIPITAGAMIGIAVMLDVGIYARLRRRGVHLVVLAMASLGVAIAMRGAVQIFWGGEAVQFPRVSKQFYRLPLDVRVPPDNIFIGVVAVLLVIGLWLFLTRSKMGKAMRATADNPDLARVSGINTQHVIWWTWTTGAVLAATAGVLLAVFQAQLFPIMGWRFLIPLFSAVILGGIGNPYGALVGALIVGVSSELSTQWINPSYKTVVAFAILIVVLLVRPNGLFGSRD